MHFGGICVTIGVVVWHPEIGDIRDDARGERFGTGRVWEDGWMQERMHDQGKAIDRSDMKRDAELV